MIDDGFLPDAHQSPLERPSLAQRIAAVALDFLRRHGPRLADEPSAQFPLVDLDAQRRSRYPETGGGLGEGEHLGNEDGLHRVDLRESRGQEPDALAVALGGGVRKSGFGGGLDAVVQVQRSGLHVRRHRVPLASVGSENLHGIAYVVKRLSHVLPFLVILFLASLAPAPSGTLNDPAFPPAVHSVSRGAPGVSSNGGRATEAVGEASPRLAAALPSAGAPASVPATEHGEVGTALVGGYATWYETPGYTAAAGPLLREMLGADWRGSVVIVEGPGRLSVRVALTDACACGERHGLPTLLDLSRTAFAELADPSTGIVAVSIEIPAQLPSTDTQP